MTKTRVPASIDEKNHQRIKDLIKTHPELNYKKISRFVNESLEEKLDKIDNELMAKRIKNAGIESFVADQKKTNRENFKKIEALEKRLDYFKKEYDFEEELKDPKSEVSRSIKDTTPEQKKFFKQMTIDLNKKFEDFRKESFMQRGHTEQDWIELEEEQESILKEIEERKKKKD